MKLDKLLTLLTDYKTTKELLRFRFVGYLWDSGWVRSVQQQKPVDRDGHPVPWVTLPFIHFIEKRLESSLTMFEFGSGYSTRYFSTHVKSIISVENDRGWFEKMSADSAVNVKILFHPVDDTENYERSIIATGKQFDIVFVDGRRRVNCIKNSVGQLTNRGIVILDDSERDEYRSGVTYLKQSGFRLLDFWGVAPGMLDRKCTSVFYRDNNCLGI